MDDAPESYTRTILNSGVLARELSPELSLVVVLLAALLLESWLMFLTLIRLAEEDEDLLLPLVGLGDGSERMIVSSPFLFRLS